MKFALMNVGRISGVMYDTRDCTAVSIWWLLDRWFYDDAANDARFSKRGKA